MPIKPENKARYPKDWKDVRHRILQRANWRCEHPNCRARHGVTGYWRKGLFHRLPDVLWDAGYTAGDVVACENGEKLKIIKIALTIAHLDHTPENCTDDNLRAWCQRHHLAYDAEHHKITAYRTRKARLCFHQNMTHKEAGMVMGLSESSVQKYVTAALKALRIGDWHE